jgi:hypothetical protein
MLAAFDTRAARGSDLLLEHCAALERWDRDSLSAAERLEQELGPLARLLLFALAPGQPRPGSSSP